MKASSGPAWQVRSNALKHAQDLVGAGKGHGLGDTALLIPLHNWRITVRADERYNGHICVQLCVQSLESKPLIAAVPL